MIAPRKILVMKLRALGDTILMTAPLQELRRAFPDAEIHAIVSKPWAEILEHHPAVDKIWTYERHKEATSRAKTLARLALTLRREKYDCVVNLHASPSSSTLAYALGAKVRSIHFHGHKDKNRHSTVVVPGKGTLKPVIERDMDTVRALGVSIPAGRMPEIFIQPGEIDRAKHRLEQKGLTGPLLALGIGASRQTKVWPLDRFASLAIRWCDQYQGSVVCFTSQTEEEIARKFFQHVDEKLLAWYQDRDARNAVRARIASEVQIPVRAIGAIVKNAALYLGNDSGPKHIAVACGTPTVTVFGPEDPFEWHPYPLAQHPIHYIEGLPCRKDHQPGMRPWCGLHECVIEEHRCMRGITEDEVFRTVHRLYEQNRDPAVES